MLGPGWPTLYSIKLNGYTAKLTRRVTFPRSGTNLKRIVYETWVEHRGIGTRVGEFDSLSVAKRRALKFMGSAARY